MNYDNLSGEARELILYAENVEAFADMEHNANRLLAKHWVNRTFNRDLAPWAFRHMLISAAKQYHLEHGSMTTRWTEVFTKVDRDRLADALVDHFLTIVRQPEVWGDLGEPAAAVLRKHPRVES